MQFDKPPEKLVPPEKITRSESLNQTMRESVKAAQLAKDDNTTPNMQVIGEINEDELTHCLPSPNVSAKESQISMIAIAPVQP